MKHLELALSFVLAVLTFGCNDNAVVSPPLRAFEASDPCHAYANADACAADAGCGWVAVEACPTGTVCPEGFCSTRDACASIEDRETCEVHSECAWADIALAEACADTTCGGTGGVCYTKTDGGGTSGCLCACPLYCTPDGDCGACECDCPVEPDTGGGTCTCACPACAPGESCPPCDCACQDGGGDECGSTCTCACPACEPGTECPPCECACGDTSTAPAPAETCACPDCAPGTECPPCTCETTTDPCTEYVDETACGADTACVWYAIGAPCVPEEPCRSGVCQSASTSGGDGCVCACPACAPGETCPPCDCDCSGGGSTGCAVPTSP